MPTVSFVRHFEELAHTDVDYAGEKGANPGGMTAAKRRVMLRAAREGISGG